MRPFPYYYNNNSTSYPELGNGLRNRAKLDFGISVKNAYDKVNDVKCVLRCTPNGELHESIENFTFLHGISAPVVLSGGRYSDEGSGIPTADVSLRGEEISEDYR